MRGLKTFKRRTLWDGRRLKTFKRRIFQKVLGNLGKIVGNLGFRDGIFRKALGNLGKVAGSVQHGNEGHRSPRRVHRDRDLDRT